MKKDVSRLTRYLLLPIFLSSATFLHAQNTLPPDKVLARNSRVAVTYSDFSAELARIPQKERFEIQISREKTAMLLDNLLTNKTLAQEARDHKLDASPEVQAEIANQIDKVLAKYRGQQVQANLPKIDLLPRAREAYLTAPEKLDMPALHDVWHVLISMKGRTAEQAHARAEEVRKKLQAGESRDKLAAEYSDDPSRKMNQGHLGLYNVEGFDPLFAAAIKAMKVGDVTTVESSHGLHVAKLLEYRPSTRYSFEAAKAALLYEAETEYVVSAWNNYLRKISSDPKLFVDIDALEAIRPKLPEIPPAAPEPAAAPTAAATTAPAPATTPAKK
jgi:parvulin-like peptidyl-prolyl isomerase